MIDRGSIKRYTGAFGRFSREALRRIGNVVTRDAGRSVSLALFVLVLLSFLLPYVQTFDKGRASVQTGYQVAFQPDVVAIACLVAALVGIVLTAVKERRGAIVRAIYSGHCLLLPITLAAELPLRVHAQQMLAGWWATLALFAVASIVNLVAIRLFPADAPAKPETLSGPARAEALRNPDTRELLLKEFEHCSATFIANEQMGEGRVTFFITVAGVVLAAVVSLYTDAGGSSKSAVPLGLMSAASLAASFLFGIFTLRRIVTRNRETDKCKRQMNRIRSYFVENGDTASLWYVPYDPYKPVRRREIGWSYGKGGLLEMVMLVNSIVLGAAVAFLLSAATAGYCLDWCLEAGVLVAIHTWVTQVLIMKSTFGEKETRCRGK